MPKRGEKLREKAAAEGKSMALCFEQARAAYETGEKAKAKKLSDEGKVAAYLGFRLTFS